MREVRRGAPYHRVRGAYRLPPTNTSGIPLTVRHQIKIASTSGLPLDAVGPGPL